MDPSADASLEEVLDILSKCGVELELNNGKLRAFPKKNITPLLLRMLNTHKAPLWAHLLSPDAIDHQGLLADALSLFKKATVITHTMYDQPLTKEAIVWYFNQFVNNLKHEYPDDSPVQRWITGGNCLLQVINDGTPQSREVARKIYDRWSKWTDEDITKWLV